MQRLLDGTGVPLVTVGFSPPDAMAGLGRYLGLTGAVLSDEARALYGALGLGRAPIWRVYSPGTVAYYARAKLTGATLRQPVEDTRQLGGDALSADGMVRRLWAPRSPDDRVPAATFAAAAVAAAADPASL
ncbi:MAG TPA: hypothetical protein VFP61_05025 [Acidimicrobiales bacterium]|nr:hypothetical protein [Acidimicrobiales bacterium]